MKKIVTGLIIFTVLASGCTLFKKDPYTAVNSAVVKFSTVKKAQNKLTLSGVINSPAGEKPATVKITIDGTGPTDSSDLEAPKADMDFKVSIIADDQGGSGDVLFRAVNKKIYFNVKDFQVPGDAGKNIKTELASLFNVWWILPSDDSSNPFKQLADNKKKIKELFSSTKFFSSATEEGPEMIQGVPSTRYHVEVDKEALKKFIVEMGKIADNDVKPEEQQAIADRLKETEFSGLVWVGDDGAVHRIKGVMTVQPTQGSSGSFDLDYTAWDFNKDVAITEPPSPQEFNPFVLFPLFGALQQTEDATPLGKDQVKTPVAPKK